MTEEKRDDRQSLLDKLLSLLLRLDWLDVLGDVWKALRNAVPGQSYKGPYEVLEYESTLELKDRGGKQATFKKRKKVRYLQDNIIAHQDQAWGDGEILIDYHCTPGIPVDRYRSGYKTYVLISRREVKNKGDVDEFNIEWRMRQGFLRRTEQWETHITCPMKVVRVKVLFPISRPPRSVTVIEGNRRRSRSPGKVANVLLPDGRCLITWEMRNPRLYENYILQWKW